MRNVIITEQELDKILELIVDWRRPWSMMPESEVNELEKSLKIMVDLGEPEGEDE